MQMEIKQFNNINGLTWLPWVGSEYQNLSNDRILFIGESHYYETAELQNSRSSDKYYTINCIQDAAVDKKWPNKTYNNLIKIINRDGSGNSEKWQYYAYTNLIQRIIRKNSRPTIQDYKDGLNTLFDLIKVLKPNYCVFIGVTVFNHIYDYLNSNNIPHRKIKKEDKINGSFPRVIELTFNDEELAMIGIKHIGRHINIYEWLEFIDKNTNGVIKNRYNNKKNIAQLVVQ